tara:strand:- start:483 stop:644 length:162 start_codon:yes stop_codon:yes gene_type:complete
MRIEYTENYEEAIFKTKEEAQEFAYRLKNKDLIFDWNYTVGQIKAGFVVYRRG